MVAAEFGAGFGAGGHVVHLDDVALADKSFMAVPGILAVGEDQERAIDRGDLAGIIFQIIRAAEQAEAAFLVGKSVAGAGVEVEQDGDALGGGVGMDVAVFLVGVAAQRGHQRGAGQVEGEFLGGEVAKNFAFQAGEEGFGGLAEFEGFDRKTAAAAHHGQGGDDGGERLGFDKFFHHDVAERVGGDRGGGKFVEIEGRVEG